MRYLGVNELRDMFLRFFEEKGCLCLKSFSLVPHNDNSLLIINSGMAPMKPWFTGQEIPPRKRVTTCQKCIRTGDLENVGKTARHGTYFEMLGNFSFGDYFKKEAIPWAWEFLTERVGLDPDRLYPSVYVDDDEAYNIWLNDMHIPAERIYRFGKADNFWEHGAGPCGPCSEIYYDRGPEHGNGPEDVMGGEGDRFMEVWNIVFTQFNNDGKGNYTELEQKNIDTGMGLERLAVAVQDVGSIFDVDTLKSLRDLICSLAGGIKYGIPGTEETDVSVRICTDHARSMTFMVSDGIMPSNNGRGYVLRRIIRRAVRHGRKLGIKGAFLSDLAMNVIESSKDGYPELLEKKDFILNVIQAEEEKFEKTYYQGMEILQEMEKNLVKEGKTRLSGQEAFRLYDTYGFPLDNTKDILEESGLQVDEEGFLEAMKEQKEKARTDRMNSGKNAEYMGHGQTVYNEMDPSINTEFQGYDKITLESTVESLALLPEGEDEKDEVVSAITDGQTGAVITKKTCFYGTMGGQTGDKGIISFSGPDGEESLFRVLKTEHVSGGKIAHIGRVEKGMFRLGDRVLLKVDKENRESISRNHSATHLLQKALREVLGTHVEQAGSYQDNERTRFDFSHFKAMTPEEIEKVEKLVNLKIREKLPVETRIMSLEDARKTGAMALFGEKYSQEVRVVSMGDFSTELCGGTHVSNTGDIGQFRILSENGVAAGVRRIEAVTADEVISFYKGMEDRLLEVCRILKANPSNVSQQIKALQKEIKDLKSENEALKSEKARNALQNTSFESIDIEGVKFTGAHVPGVDMNDLRNLGDSLKNNAEDSIILLISDKDGKASMVSMASDGAVKKGAHAGNLIKQVAPMLGGGGGGRPNMAQAGGKDVSRIPEALKKAEEIIRAQLS